MVVFVNDDDNIDYAKDFRNYNFILNRKIFDSLFPPIFHLIPQTFAVIHPIRRFFSPETNFPHFKIRKKIFTKLIAGAFPKVLINNRTAF